MPVRVRPILVPKVAHAGKHHSNACLIGRSNYFCIAHRATRLNYRGNAIGGGVIQTVTEREKRIRCHHRTGYLQAGVFGSPTVVVNGEPFWGIDKFEQIDRWLTRGGW